MKMFCQHTHMWWGCFAITNLDFNRCCLSADFSSSWLDSELRLGTRCHDTRSFDLTSFSSGCIFCGFHFSSSWIDTALRLDTRHDTRSLDWTSLELTLVVSFILRASRSNYSGKTNDRSLRSRQSLNLLSNFKCMKSSPCSTEVETLKIRAPSGPFVVRMYCVRCLMQNSYIINISQIELLKWICQNNGKPFAIYTNGFNVFFCKM